MANYFLRITWFLQDGKEVAKILEKHFTAVKDSEACGIAIGIWQEERKNLFLPENLGKYDTDSALFKQIPYP